MPLPPLHDPERFLPRLRGVTIAVIAAGFLFPALMAVNLLQALSLIIRPFSPAAFRRFNCRVANIWWGWCVLGAEKLHGVTVIRSGDGLPVRENAIVIANHQEIPDIPVIFSIAREQQRLGDLKFFVKDIVKYVPGVGWGMLFLGCIYVKRKWSVDRDHLRRMFRRFVDRRIPLWLVMFVEGSRMRVDKVERSRRIAERRGMKPIRHVMIPQNRGFIATVQSRRGHVTAVYDFTIGYEVGVTTLWQWCKGYTRRVHLHVRHYPVSEIPDTDDGITSWLYRRFEEKDELLEQFYRDGIFSA